ncbi:MAG TPA: hypothetical protein ACFYD6_06720 [Candidatus Brocadiia bacterium]|nr:hypothetical protein [Planctomycetota bacterium]MDO8093318.1 hypothetical protein [Candidatus Brocadiales bacterium]
MTQDKPKTGIGLTFLLGMLILFTASFGIVLARRNGVIEGERKTLIEKVNQLEEKLRILTHSKEELEVVRSNLVAEIERLKLALSSQKMTDTEQQSKEDEGTGNSK